MRMGVIIVCTERLTYLALLTTLFSTCIVSSATMGSVPGSAMGSVPGSAMGSVPGSAMGSVPGSATELEFDCA